MLVVVLIALKFLSCQFAQGYHAHVKAIVLQLLVGHNGANAVFAEAAGFDAQLAENVEDGAEDIAVALELNDDERTDVGILARFHVMELHIVVDGQAFRLAIVDECDTMELVADGGVNICQAEVHALLQELLVAVLACYLLTGHRDALLLRASVIVLRLYFKESVIAIHVSPDAYLLPWGTTVVVLQVELVGLGVPIGRHVVGNLAAVVELCIIFALRQLQQVSQRFLVRHEFRVGAIHQTNLLHLVQRYRLQICQQIVYSGINFHLFQYSTRQI